MVAPPSCATLLQHERFHSLLECCLLGQCEWSCVVVSATVTSIRILTVLSIRAAACVAFTFSSLCLQVVVQAFSYGILVATVGKVKVVELKPECGYWKPIKLSQGRLWGYDC